METQVSKRRIGSPSIKEEARDTSPSTGLHLLPALNLAVGSALRGVPFLTATRWSRLLKEPAEDWTPVEDWQEPASEQAPSRKSKKQKKAGTARQKSSQNVRSKG